MKTIISSFFCLYSFSGAASATFSAGGTAFQREGKGTAVARMYSDARRRCQGTTAKPVGQYECYGAAGLFQCTGDFVCSSNKTDDEYPSCAVSGTEMDDNLHVNCFTPHYYREDLITEMVEREADRVCGPVGFEKLKVFSRRSYTGYHFSQQFRCN